MKGKRRLYKEEGKKRKKIITRKKKKKRREKRRRRTRRRGKRIEEGRGEGKKKTREEKKKKRGRKKRIITPARDPKQRDGLEINVPDTSKNVCGTGTDEVTHHCNCSRKTFFVDLFQRAHKIFIQELPKGLSYIKGPL